jgi:tripartite-type tricarboxylate transporter receptor subunit TctC
MRRRLLASLVALAASFVALGVRAQPAVQGQADPAAAYPDRPVHLVIPFSAGGGNDIVARIVAAKLADAWGQPVIVDNKPGGQGIIAVEFVQKSAADGYTILMGPSGPMTGNPAIYSKLPYATLRDFVPVAMIGSFPLILVVNAQMPINSVADLVAYGKSHPRNANYGTTAALFQLASELFNQRTGTSFQNIPYKSSGDFVNAVLGNEITMAFADPPPAAGPIRAHRLRPLAVTSAKRHPAYPDVPTLAEAGVPDVAFNIWMGLFLPAGAAAPVVTKLHDQVIRTNGLADVQARFAALGVEPSTLSSEDFAKLVAADIARWTAVAQAAHIKAD